MTANLPAIVAPLTPPDCDLRAYEFMPLSVARLRDADIIAAVSAEGFRAAILLWCAAWHQVPAASLPDDDKQLARLAGYGIMVAAWKEIREEALYGFVKCSDGRLYHPVIAEKAVEGWEVRQKYVARSRRANDAKYGAPRPDPEGSDEVSLKETVASNKDGPVASLKEQISSQGTVTGKERGSSSELPLGGPKPKTSKRGSRISADWTLSPKGRAFAIDHSVVPEDIPSLAEAFHSYWLSRSGQKGVMLDWEACWRTWVLNEVKWRKERANGRQPAGAGDRGSGRSQSVSNMLAGAMAAADRRR